MDAGISLQSVLVGNGSQDATAEIIDQLIAHGLPITKAIVPVNQGQGLFLPSNPSHVLPSSDSGKSS